MELNHVIEALLFASQKPLSSREAVVVLRAAIEANPDDAEVVALGGTKPAEVDEAFEALRIRYDDAGSAFALVEGAQGWQVVTRPGCARWVRQLFPENRPTRLSGPALETLAIIAYRQPITRADLEAVRGVSVDGVLQTLLDRGLVRIAGRADVPGRPLLYETTSTFLDHFGMKNLDELPNADELRRVELPKAEIPPAKAGAPDPAPANPQGEMNLGEEAGTEGAPTEDSGAAGAPAENLAVEPASDAATVSPDGGHKEKEPAP